jgi:hypothetical protein
MKSTIADTIKANLISTRSSIVWAAYRSPCKWRREYRDIVELARFLQDKITPVSPQEMIKNVQVEYKTKYDITFEVIPSTVYPHKAKDLNIYGASQGDIELLTIGGSGYDLFSVHSAKKFDDTSLSSLQKICSIFDLQLENHTHNNIVLNDRRYQAPIVRMGSDEFRDDRVQTKKGLSQLVWIRPIITISQLYVRAGKAAERELLYGIVEHVYNASIK